MDTARRADTNWPEECSILRGVMLYNKVGELAWECWLTAQELAGHWSVNGEQLHWASLVYFNSYNSNSK